MFSNELIKIGALVFDDSSETQQNQQQADGEEGQDPDEAVDDRETRKMRFKVYEIRNDVDELVRGTSAAASTHTLKMKVIVFACKTKEQRDSLLKQTTSQVCGHYLVQRHEKEQKLWVTKMQSDGNGFLLANDNVDLDRSAVGGIPHAHQ